MRQRIWRSILALGLGAIASVAAQAQAPAAAAGCAGCAAAVASCGCEGKAHARKAGLVRIGEGCASQASCSSPAAERTFMFGSCKQFFKPGADCKIKNPVYGPREGASPCTYGSYLNR